MRILITGATGFVGSHLIDFLGVTHAQDEVHGTSFNGHTAQHEGVTLHHIDLREPDAVHELLSRIAPDRIYHLAAQAVVKASFDAPWATLETNIRSQLNLLDACVSLGLSPRILVVSTGELYANATLPDRPTGETVSPVPTSPYGVSKLTQEFLGLQYHLSRQLQVIVVRPFNQIGPRQRTGNVVPDFSSQIARIEAGLQPAQMRVGNLDARRDFTDVRDVVRAMHLVMEAGAPGEIYNIASGHTHSIHAILDALLVLTTHPIEVVTDAARMRPANVPLLWGDPAKLQQATGWQPTIPLKQTLLEVLDEQRKLARSNIS